MCILLNGFEMAAEEEEEAMDDRRDRRANICWGRYKERSFGAGWKILGIGIAGDGAMVPVRRSGLGFVLQISSDYNYWGGLVIGLKELSR